MELNFSELRELVATLSQTNISELTLKSADFELTLRKQGGGGGAASPPEAIPAIESAPLAVPDISSLVNQVSAPAPAAAPPKTDSKLLEITSPMVGTFYRSPAPDESPFVEVGDPIKNGQTVCIIEAMKLMNELESEISGEIVEILAENAQPVEFGQPLMRVKPT